MKTIRVDGRTYAAVEVDENVACKGCIFYTVGWDMNTPRCTAANIPEFQSRRERSMQRLHILYGRVGHEYTTMHRG
nr:MAG TPA_asm: hypothetical protein [Caudoviricetes sp.]